MAFGNHTALIALAAVLVPIILHLLNRRSAKLLDWGAMHFLMGSLISRRRRLLLEEMMLLAMRCLLFALAALVVARPLVTGLSGAPWMLVLPAILLGAVALGVGTAFWQERVWRYRLWAAGCLLLLIAAGLVAFENNLQLARRIGSDRDVAIVIDGSSSMKLKIDGKSNFDRALDEARAAVASLGASSNVQIVVAGAAPVWVTPRALRHRDQIEAKLNALAAVGGSADIPAAIDAAVDRLRQSGSQAAKQVLVFTDQQKEGWNIDETTRWSELSRKLKADAAAVGVYVRGMPLPSSVRNVALEQLTLSRTVVGPNQPLPLEVHVKNTGSEAVSAAKVELLVDGERVGERSYDKLDPGRTAVLNFTHRFDRPGARIFQARIATADDIDDDNVRLAAVRVSNKLPVLIINGNPAVDYFDRASAYVELALAPEMSTDASEDGEFRPLIDATVADVAGAAAVRNFADYRVVILADVPRLSDAVARRLADFVAQGGGLLVAPGSRAQPEFYNQWRTADAQDALLPGRLLERRHLVGKENEVRPAVSTFAHPALATHARKSDLGGGIFRSYWKLGGVAGDNTEAGGNFNNGDPLLLEGRVGTGTVTLLAASLDNAGSNLARRKSFPVFLHLLLYHLSEAGQNALTFEAGNEAVLILGGETSHPIAFRYWRPGLDAQYIVGSSLTQPPATKRIDATLNFDWPSGIPAPEIPAGHFAARWQGALVADKSETYKLILSGQGAAQLWLDGKLVLQRPNPGAAEVSLPLVAGSHHDLRVELVQPPGPSQIKLEWESPSHPRQTVPDSAFEYLQEQPRGQSEADAFVVTSPDGGEQPIQAEVRNNVLAVKLPAAAVPGLYRVRPPESLSSLLASAQDDKRQIPVVFAADPRESQLTKLKDDDWAVLSAQGALTLLADVDAVRKVAQGGIPGQELWKFLALAALIILIAEIALARWIAIQRQVNADPVGDFEFRGRSAHQATLERFNGPQLGGATLGRRSTDQPKTGSP